MKKRRFYQHEFHPKAVKMLMKSLMQGGFTVNLLAPYLGIYIFYELFSLTFSLVWIALHHLIFVGRYLISRKVLRLLESSSPYTKELYYYIALIGLSGLLYAILIVTAMQYGSDQQIFLLAALILSMVSAGVSTLSSVFIAFFTFSVTIILPMIITFAIFPGEYNLFFSGVILFYLIVVNRNAYDQFQAFNETLIYKDQIEELNHSLTQRVKSEVTKNLKKEKLLQQQSRLAQMGEMISMIAHQWRQPLSAISATVGTLQIRITKYKGESKEELSAHKQELKDHLEKIQEYVRFLSHTVDDFRNFFKPQKEKKLVSLCKPIEQALQIIEPTMLSKTITFEKDLTCNPTIELFQNEIIQVILNLLKNAEDNFVARAQTNAQLKIVTSQNSDYAFITIQDNGGGIDDEIIEMIFDPYFSTKDEKNGTGLGLYMSKIMVEDHHNGHLRVENHNNGASFRIALPLQSAP